MSTMIAMESEVAENVYVALVANTKALAEARNREEQLRKQADRNKLMTLREACEYLGKDEDSVLNYRKQKLPYYKKGKSVWFTKGDIDDWIADGYVNLQAPKKHS